MLHCGVNYHLNFVLFVAQRKGKICLPASPLALIPPWTHLLADKYITRRIYCWFPLYSAWTGAVFCFVKKLIKKQKRQENNFQFLVWLNARDTSPLCPWLCWESMSPVKAGIIRVIIQLYFNFQGRAEHLFAVSLSVSLPNVSAERKLNLSSDPASILQLIKSQKKSSHRLLYVADPVNYPVALTG